LCGALETAHQAGTLHRDIKPANILINDYGEPQLSDFGIAHIEGGYETATGYFSGTIDYTAPEVLTGTPATVASDVYSLGATVYALIAGNAAHERNTGEELLAQYMRISTTRVPDLRPGGIPDPVCSAIEKAMSVDPAERPASAAEFGRELQAAQRRNGLKPDSMAITSAGIDADRTISVPADVSLPPCAPISAPGRKTHPPAATAAFHGPTAQFSEPRLAHSLGAAMGPLGEPGQPTSQIQALPPSSTSIRARATAWLSAPGKKQNRIASVAAAAVVALTLVVGGVYYALPHRNDIHPSGASQPGTQWKPIISARVARDEVAATEADGIIWIFGGIRSDGAVTGQQEGYDADIKSWTDDDDLPVPVQNAMAVTWQGTPVVLGGWRTANEKRYATDQVWRVINSHWVQLPHMLQPRAAAAAAVVGDRIVVVGGVDASGALLNTTEIFDGTSWTLGAPIPTPRQTLAAASDGKLLYAVGGSNGNADLTTVEAYDPAGKTWTT
ncbi:serine/threonine-protein kinase, partial [Mycobacterium haemophilum]